MRDVWLFVIVLITACRQTDTFICEGDGECVDGVRSGTCEASGYCSFPDPSCASFKRYGEYAEEGLAGACVVVSSTESCRVCEGDVCEPAAAGTACTIACEDYVFGLGPEDHSCVAFAAKQGAGVCDAAGGCVPDLSSCTEGGAVLATCEVACARSDHNCELGTKVEAVAPATLCMTMVETDMCHSSCMDVKNTSSELTPRQCDDQGRCVAAAPTSCEAYLCEGDVCKTSCTASTDCAPLPMVGCKDNMCM